MFRTLSTLSTLAALAGCIEVPAPSASPVTEGEGFVVGEDGQVTLGDDVSREGGASSCAANEALVSDGTTWSCQSVGQGGSATISADAPLVADVDEGDVTVSIDATRVPVLSAACSEGEVAKTDESGDWTCAPDDDGLATLIAACADGNVVAFADGAFVCDTVASASGAFALNGDGAASFDGDVAIGGTDADPFDEPGAGRRITMGPGATGPTFATVVGGAGADGLLRFAASDDATPRAAIGSAANRLVAYTSDGAALVERLRIDEAGRVGIGTPAPGFPLDIEGNTRVHGNQLRIQGAAEGATTTGLAYVSYFNNAGTQTGYAGFASDNDDDLYVANVSGGNVFLEAGSAEVWLDGTNGNVGVGTQTPQTPLHVEGSARFNDGLALHGTDMSNTSNLVVRFFNGAGSQTGYLGYQATVDDIFAINASSASDFSVAAGSAGALWLNGDDGNFGVGVNNPAHRLHVAGDICADTDGNGSCDGTVLSTSDRRLKTDLEVLDDVVDKLLTLSGIRFTFKDDAAKRRHIGLIAQEVQRHYPELITEGADGYLHMDYTKLTAVLVEAVKEQQGDIEQLRAENEALKARVERIEAALEKQLR